MMCASINENWNSYIEGITEGFNNGTNIT